MNNFQRFATYVLILGLGLFIGMAAIEKAQEMILLILPTLVLSILLAFE